MDMSLENMDLNRISVIFNSSQRRRGSYPTHRPDPSPHTMLVVSLPVVVTTETPRHTCPAVYFDSDSTSTLLESRLKTLASQTRHIIANLKWQEFVPHAPAQYLAKIRLLAEGIDGLCPLLFFDLVQAIPEAFISDRDALARFGKVSVPLHAL